MHFHSFSGGTIQRQPLQVPQAPAWAGGGRGAGWHRRVPGQQAAGEEPRGSHKNHKWRIIHPNAERWPKKCTQCENLCHSVLYLQFLQIKNLFAKNLCLFFPHWVNLPFYALNEEKTFCFYLTEKDLVSKNKRWEEQPGQSQLVSVLNHTCAGDA